jgi:hypothetical protein
MVEAHTKESQQHGTPKVDQIYRIHVSPALESRYLQRQTSMFYSRTKELFHGTSRVAADLINKGGFRLPGNHNGNLGDCVYFAPAAAKSAHYSKRLGDKILLLVDVITGREWHIPRQQMDLNAQKVLPKFDSVFCPGGSMPVFPEFCVYHVDQSVPRYFITWSGNIVKRDNRIAPANKTDFCGDGFCTQGELQSNCPHDCKSPCPPWLNSECEHPSKVPSPPFRTDSCCSCGGGGTCCFDQFTPDCVESVTHCTADCAHPTI